ncbi:MAG: hypothetical protein QOG62_2085 [Thermoleophilaceae bacterium]|jgi:hypothetical protein|nr:hypothetical protein [Thermoleophilaceae bacterium]
MSTGPVCEETRALAPELALGIVDGQERSRVLRHLATCPDCRRLVDDYTELADELLELAPMHEPPLGFESRVLEQIEPRSPRHRPSRARRLVPAFAAAGVAVAATFAAMTVTYSGDHELAQSYRATLAQANGEAFEAAQLSAPGGKDSGTVFAYAGAPSWILVTVDAPAREPGLRGELVTTDGVRVPLPDFKLDSTGSWGGAIPISAERVSEVRLLGKARGQVFEAHLPKPGQNPLYVEGR